MSLYKSVKKMKGIIKISVEGFFVERFINLCLYEKVEIWDIERVNDGVIYVKIYPYSYEKVNDIATKTKCKLEIIEKNGVPFVIKRYRHRKIFAILTAAVVTAITITNLFVWQVDIIGEFSIPIEEIKELLNEENIKVGVLKKDIDIDVCKLNISLKRDDIAWLGISIKGTKVTVEIVEKTLAEEDKYQGTVGNIISDKEGIVEKIYVAEGTAMVKKGEIVDKGSLLISGLVNSELSESRYVRASGEVTLRTTYIEKTKIPFEKDLVTKTGQVKKYYKLKINNYVINLGNKVTNFEKYDTISQEKVFSLFGKIKTPLSLVEETFEEIKVERLKYTMKQAEDLAIISNNEKLKEIIPKEAERVNYFNKVRQNDEYLEVETVVQCIETAGTYEKIEGN